MNDSIWNGKEATIARDILTAWEAGDDDDAVLKRLTDGGISGARAVRALDMVASACSTAALLEAGLRRDQVSSDLDGDVLFESALARATSALDAQQPHPLRSLAELAGALQSDDAYDRQDAVYELGETGARQATGLLVSALGDEDLWVQVYAVQALAALGSRQATAPLCELLASAEDRTLACNIVKALGRIGDTAALPALVAATEHKNPFVRYDAVVALGDLGSEDAIPAVEALLDDETRPVETDEEDRTSMETEDRICDRAGEVLKQLRGGAAAKG